MSGGAQKRKGRHTTPPFVNMPEAVHPWSASPRRAQKMLATHGLAMGGGIQNTVRRAVRHHKVYRWEVGDRVGGNGDGKRGAEVRRVVAVLIAPVGEGPVAKFGLVRGSVDLFRSAMDFRVTFLCLV